MPKRKIRDSLLPPEQKAAALAAIKEVLKHPRVLTLDEERDFLERRARGAIVQHAYIATERRGKLVYREHGKAGADLPVPPYYWKILKWFRDFETESEKILRGLRLRTLNPQTARQRKADETAQRIRKLAETIIGRGRIKAIAHKVGCSTRTVERALKD